MDNRISKLYRKRGKLEDFLDLTPFDKNKESTLVRGTNAECWFKFDDERVLFKKYDDIVAAYGEVVYSKIAQKYDINCAKYDFAKYKKDEGTISFDLAKDNKMIIDGVTLFSRYNPNVPDIMKKNSRNLEVLLMLNKKYNNYKEFMYMFQIRYPDDALVLENELIKTFLLDILLDHVDKNLWNILIVTDEYGNNAHFYSIDNSHIARLNEGSKYIEEAINDIQKSNGKIKIEDYLTGGVYGYYIASKDKDYNPIQNLIDFAYNLDEASRDDLISFVRSMDIKDILEETNKNGIVSETINNWILSVFNCRKNTILKKLNNLDDNYKDEHTNKNFHLRKRK